MMGKYKELDYSDLDEVNRDFEELEAELSDFKADWSEMVEQRNEALARVEELEEALSTALDAMIWTTGSYDFAPEGKARKGALKILFPAIELAQSFFQLSEDDEIEQALGGDDGTTK